MPGESTGRLVRWLVLSMLLAAVILVPFFLFEKQVSARIDELLVAAGSRRVAAGMVLASALAVDILLPVPSSIVSTTAGYLLGFAGGLAASFAGMTVGCMLGYLLGSLGGRPLAARMVGQTEMTRLDALGRQFGHWVIVVCRPVPVLAEASVLLSGVSRMPFGRFLLMTALSNLGISAVYAAVGQWSSQKGAFLLAFAASIAIPGVAMLVVRKTTDRRQ